MSSVVKGLIGGIIEELLGFVIENLFLNKNVKWGWAIINCGEDELVHNIILSNEMEVHADTWLHGGGNWLGEVGGSFWDLVALLNNNIKVNIRVEWDWLSTNIRPGVGITVSEVVWAVNLSFISLVELTNSELKTFEGLGGSEGEDEVSSVILIGGISNHSSVLEVSLVGNGSPVTDGTFWSGTCGSDINANS